ncbi:hypothetical protein E8E13_000065 [Curvularia kusanoi]|uniref:Uncharacterized protein n=1 Tax=Curvularia kusanoi TaxID=90978 RepID=A0A9P4W6J5_CURKU|nr:hypothetical protein E8E13_000065 [Curvularia kusanoi]
MDVNKCAELHNKILEHGWLRSGKSRQDLERNRKTWFDYHGDEAEAIRDILSPDIIAFLERAYVVDWDGGHAFFYYVAGLFTPSLVHELSETFNNDFSEDGMLQNIVLYNMNSSFGSHPVGLVYDQEQHTAILCVDLDDGETIQNGRTEWFPLEVVLEAWLDMIEQGKVVATSDIGEVEAPWKLVPYSPKILQDTVDVFDSLVQEIVSRMPEGSGTQEDSNPSIDGTILEVIDPRRGFAYHFNKKVKRPPFRFIAPGLEISSSSEVTRQPFALIHPDDGHMELIPVLLFRAVSGTSLCMAPASGDECPFGYPFSEVEQYHAGLYLSCTSLSYNSFEDEVTLVLPFRIGAQGFARKSDGARFGEDTQDPGDVEPDDTFADVYQPGQQPFTEMHAVRLISVLRNWIDMIRSGVWEVDADGVVGGVGEWRKADMEDSWEDFIIPTTW